MSAAKKISAEETRRPNIYEYHDYRSFLKDWFEYLSGNDTEFSARQLAAKADMATGYLPMVLQGKRNLTAKAVQKMEPHLKLSESEISYLKCLQALADSEHQEERLAALKKMQKFTRYTRKNNNEVKAYKFLTRWFHVVIREMSELKDFCLDVDWICKKLIPKISRKDVKQSINFLIENEFLRVNESGAVELTEKHLECVGHVYKTGLTQFHKEMFKLAAKSIDVVPSEWRSIVGHTLSISQDQFKEVKAIMDEALQKISKIENRKSDNDIVFHTSLIAFPLTQFSKKEDAK